MSLYRCQRTMVSEDGWTENLPKQRAFFETISDIRKVFQLRICDILNLCLGKDWLCGQRFRYLAEKDIHCSVANCMANYLNHAFGNLYLPIKCDILTLAEARKLGCDRKFTVKLYNEDALSVEPIYLTFQTEPCEVPKIQYNSPTTGLRLIGTKLSRNLPITAIVPIRTTYRKLLQEWCDIQTKEFQRTLVMDLINTAAMQSYLDKLTVYQKNLLLLQKVQEVPEIYSGSFIETEDGDLAEVLDFEINDNDFFIHIDYGNLLETVSIRDYKEKWTIADNPAKLSR